MLTVKQIEAIQPLARHKNNLSESMKKTRRTESTRFERRA